MPEFRVLISVETSDSPDNIVTVREVCDLLTLRDGKGVRCVVM